MKTVTKYIRLYKVRFANPRKIVKVFGHCLFDAKCRAAAIHSRNIQDVIEVLLK